MRGERTPGAELSLSRPPEARRQYIWTDTFVFYPEARAVIRMLDDLRNRPETHRPKGLLLTAHTNNGKTALLQQYVSRHMPDPNLDGDTALFPVVYFQAPDDGQPRSLYIDILQKFGGVFSPRSSTATLKGLTLNLLQACQVRMLIVDEIHNLLAVSDRANVRTQMLNLLRYISNELRIPLVFAGVETAVRIAEADEQLRNRFEHLHLDKWTEPARMRGLLAALEKNLPLLRRSDLASDDILEFIAAETDGLIGEIAELVRRAATEAVGGREEITLHGLRTCGYIGPSRRLHRV